MADQARNWITRKWKSRHKEDDAAVRDSTNTVQSVEQMPLSVCLPFFEGYIASKLTSRLSEDLINMETYTRHRAKQCIKNRAPFVLDVLPYMSRAFLSMLSASLQQQN
ncbi:unnamed protein product [Alternaria alternata]